MSNKSRIITIFSGFAYFVFLVLGIHAAYNDRWIVALFFAITWAGETIAISIDYWPGMQRREFYGKYNRNNHG